MGTQPILHSTMCAKALLLTLDSPVMRSTKGSMGALISSVSSTKPAVQNTIMAFTTCSGGGGGGRGTQNICMLLHVVYLDLQVRYK
jgi:hypothetical protein